MKRLIILIFVISILILTFFLYDFGIPVSGRNIEMLTKIDADAGIEIIDLNNTKNEHIHLESEEAQAYLENLKDKDYCRITKKQYDSSFSGNHYLIFARSYEGHAITIELCASDKMSITDENENMSEYYKD